MHIQAGVDGLIVKGIAGRKDDAYAPDTDDLIKILAEGGVNVTYEVDEARDRLVLHSTDWWGPILVLTQMALANGVGTLLANAIWEAIGKRPGRKIHIDVGSLREGDSEAKWFRGEGSAEEVLEALKVWRGE